jgi:hypothetical protein
MLNISFFRTAQDFKDITGKIFHSLGSVNINGENFFYSRLTLPLFRNIHTANYKLILFVMLYEESDEFENT